MMGSFSEFWHKARFTIVALLTLGYFIFYPSMFQRVGYVWNYLGIIPMLLISISYGMVIGGISGVLFSLGITAVRYFNQDPNLILFNAFITAGIAGITSGIFGLLSDQRGALIESEERLEERVTAQTQELAQLVTELEHAYDTTLMGWAKALELKDKETEGHSQRVTALAIQLSKHLGLPDEDLMHIRFGALLHDIGKMGVPDAILQKPGTLTPEEREIINQHPGHAHQLLKDIVFLEKALAIPCYHHERWNGKGYPKGLHGENIPLYARIFAVVDVWDALTTDRPYRKAYSKDIALEKMAAETGEHFDPMILKEFLVLVDLEQVILH